MEPRRRLLLCTAGVISPVESERRAEAGIGVQAIIPTAMRNTLSRLLFLSAIVCFALSSAPARAAESVLFNVDFTTLGTETISTTSSSATFVNRTYSGYDMAFGVKSGKDITITKETGLTFVDNNYNNYTCLAIPLTLTANNEVTVTVTLASAGKIKYGWATGDLPATPSAPTGTDYSTSATTNTITYTPTSAGSYGSSVKSCVD